MKTSKTSFECVRGNQLIRGHIIKPKFLGKFPVIILSHGFMSNQRSVWHYAKQLAELGYVAVTFDFRGGCIMGASDGRSEDMTVFTEAEDLNAVIDCVKKLPYVQSDRVSLMGCSQGGFVSGIVASRQLDKIEKLILFYPALCIPDDARAGKMLGFQFDPNNMPDILSKFPMKIGMQYASSMMPIDAIQEIRNYRGRVLLVHGTDDNVVNISYARKAQQAYGMERCYLLELEGAGHGFKGEADKIAIGAVKEFLCDREEVLTIDVQLDNNKQERKGFYLKVTLPFHGTANSKWFSGTIEPGAADVQEFNGIKMLKCTASYVLSGKDYNGFPCKVHIKNINMGSGWKPTVTTDSQALAFINDADCTAYLEQRKCGPVVHIYSPIPKNSEK